MKLFLSGVEKLTMDDLKSMGPFTLPLHYIVTTYDLNILFR